MSNYVPLANKFYSEVVNQVIENMRNEFLSEGVSEDILEKLKNNWMVLLKEKMEAGG